MRRSVPIVAALAFALALAGPVSAGPGSVSPLSLASGPSPYAGCTVGQFNNATNYVNAEVEKVFDCRAESVLGKQLGQWVPKSIYENALLNLKQQHDSRRHSIPLETSLPVQNGLSKIFDLSVATSKSRMPPCAGAGNSWDSRRSPSTTATALSVDPGVRSLNCARPPSSVFAV